MVLCANTAFEMHQSTMFKQVFVHNLDDKKSSLRSEMGNVIHSAVLDNLDELSLKAGLAAMRPLSVGRNISLLNEKLD